MVPTNEHLQTCRLTSQSLDLRLKVQLELVALFDGFTQVILNRQAVQVGGLHVRQKSCTAIFALPLHLVHGHVGAADKFCCIGRVFRIDRNANARRRQKLRIRNPEGLAQFLLDFFRDHSNVIAVRQRRQQDGEFIPPLARQGVAIAQAFAHTRRKLPQKLVANGMAIGVVDQLEAIKIEKHHGQFFFAAARLDNGHFQAVHEQVAIGQPGQQIVQGLKGNCFFCALAL